MAELQASFSDNLRSKLVKLLREDTPTAPVPFEEYDELLSTAVDVFEGFPHEDRFERAVRCQ